MSSLHRKAVADANKKFYEAHPEMAGKQLSKDDPAHAEMREEWRQYHKEAVRERSAKKKSSKGAARRRGGGRMRKKVKKPVANCPECEKDKCVVSGLKVKCGHGNRKYELALPLKGKQATENPERVLEVIGGEGSKGDQISGSLTVDKPLCPEHKPESVEVSPEPEGLTSGPKFEFKAPSKPVDGVWDSLWISDLPANEYSVSVDVCTEKEPCDFTVRAYPDIKWAISGKIGLETPKGSRNPHDADWKFSLSAKRTIAGQATEFAQEYEDQAKKILKFLTLTRDASAYFADAMNRLTGQKLEPEWPNLSLTYQAARVERSESHLVDTEYSVSFAGDPILGMKWTGDILAGLIRLPQAAAIRPILEKARDKVGAKLELRITGRLKGSLTWKKAAGQSCEIEGEIAGELGIVFYGSATVKGGFFFISFEAGAEFEAGGGMGIGFQPGIDSQGVYVSGKFYFLPIVVKAAFYADVKIKRKKKKKRNSKSPQKGASECELWGGKTWPTDKGYIIKNS